MLDNRCLTDPGHEILDNIIQNYKRDVGKDLTFCEECRPNVEKIVLYVISDTLGKWLAMPKGGTTSLGVEKLS